MLEKYTAAAIQFEPLMGEKERNITGLLALCEKAAQAGAKLIVTPEMGTTGYCWYDRAEVEPFVETVPGPSTGRFQDLARKYGCYIVIGMPEVDPASNLYYNSAVLIGPDGIIGTHRKTHPYIAEPKWSACGNLGHQVFETPIGRIALLVCMDIHFVETARLVALGGADVICHISNWLAERTPAPYWINRAFENSCYLVEGNRWGLERGVQFSGGSCVIGPDAEILAVVDSGDGMALAEIDPEKARQRQVWGENIQKRRRPELYAELMTNTFAWNPRDFFKLYDHQPLPEGREAKVAAGQFAPTANLDDNLAAMTELAEQARTKGAELLVLPEGALTGLQDPAKQALAADGPELVRLTELAVSSGLYLVAGFAEKEGDRFYNSAVLTGPSGVLAIYRKIHLNEEDERWATAGSEWKIVDLPFARVGLLIGFDASFPEAGRTLALRGADLIACPSAIRQRFHLAHAGTAVQQPAPIPTGADPYHWHQYRVRAGENNCYFVFANVLDEEKGFAGHSGIFGPDTFAFPRTESIAAANAPLAVATIDTGHIGGPYPTNVVRRKDLVLMRQPHHYEPLVVLQSE
ncbi:amidohydrolase [Aureimonas fodinaquatilis]|uniref:Amidohydrolase n=1 Tax=Aureimonas fodinaquatilis TaxID=2565783 RepID=A0A5B0DV00_9HYPH|nr:nitrilase-related carbon-nitrogen hydrolase [Aureimonas fodinaquatilis]KAA0969832.1 amidohydrolase [Aureimonas fodinaquatilis]